MILLVLNMHDRSENKSDDSEDVLYENKSRRLISFINTICICC